VKRGFRVFAAGAMALALLASACGDDGGDSTEGAATTGAASGAASGATAAAGKPKLAVIYSGVFKDGSWAEQGQKAAEKLKSEIEEAGGSVEIK
jgi:basic membrane lipoprotein Med (substrate-binding protein (PBP1-ABC) superfamily)